MTAPTLYGVYTAQFPFLDINETKVRPVIVVSRPYGAHGIVAIIPVSSSANREAIDVSLSNWRDEGFLKPSVARVHRLTAMLQSDLLSELGVLQPDDIRVLQHSLRTFLNLDPSK